MKTKIQILAVDDSAINLASIEQELKDEYEVIAVNSGSRALQYLKNETPDLILLDIQMESMDGLETLKEIRALQGGNAIPVIMLTAQNDRMTILESTKFGIYDYIVKPFQADDLHERIVRTLKRSGVLSFGLAELHAEFKKLQRELESENLKGAVLRTEEIAKYRLDTQNRQAIMKVAEKLKENDLKGALGQLKAIL